MKIKQVEGNTHSFDISELQSGVYFVTIQTVESGTRVKK
ncbi:MAG: T9SS type A sorting domain-containing protein [Saprospiraceae bacterium]